MPKEFDSYYDILTTFHPAFLLRRPEKIICVKKDLVKLCYNL